MRDGGSLEGGWRESVGLRDVKGWLESERWSVIRGWLERLKGPKHDQIECGFFYINQTSMGR